VNTQTPNPRKYAMYGLLAITVALIAYSSQDWTEGAGALRSPTSRSLMTDLALPTLTGGQWRLSEHRGQVVLINFWATWCPPCRQETPGLVKLAHAHSRENLVVAGVSLDEGGNSVVQDFVNKFHVPYPVLVPGGNSASVANVESLPTTILIDRAGRIAKTYFGAVREATFEKDIDELLAEHSSGYSKAGS
jgi:cytochrome c biogenesis protein CcmG/thiol:disulfide interchange protein DsbE